MWPTDLRCELILPDKADNSISPIYPQRQQGYNCGMKKQPILIGLVLALMLVSVVQAHPADMYFHTHRISLSSQGIGINWEIVSGPMIAQAIFQYADQDDDGDVSDEEAMAWADEISLSLSVDLDGNPLSLNLEEVDWPADTSSWFTGESPLRIHLWGDWPFEIGEAHQIGFHNRHNPKNSINWFDVKATDGLSLEIPEQNSGKLSFTFGPSGWGEGIDTVTAWESGRPSIPQAVEAVGLGEIAEEAAAESSSGSSTTSILEGLLKKQQTSPVFIFSALLIAGLLGMLHALSPGHGKTIVAAYLVGSQGRFYHAIALGLLVTFTHTGSVFALGLLTLTASRYFLAADIFPVLELASGLLILLLGLGLLYPRLRYWILYLRQQRQISRKPVEVSREFGGSKRVVIDQSIEEIGSPHSHDPSTMGYIPRGPLPSGALSGINWRSLITLGVSGGLVPCPDAIAILLIALTINRIALGISLIVSFSMGLAVVLIIIGLLIVQGKRLFERLRWFDQIAFTVHVLSAVVVLGIGLVLSLSAVRNISATNDASIVADVSRFDYQQAQVIFTALDEENRSQLFVVPVVGGEAEQITYGGNIHSYAVAPDFSSIIYAISSELNATQLWQITPETGMQEQILDCPKAFCSGITWFPDGKRILYNRLDYSSENAPSGIPSIWWLDLETRKTEPLFQDAHTPGITPLWSPDGKWLSYISINPYQVRLYQIETGASQAVDFTSGYPVVWSPDSASLLLVEMVPVGKYYYPRLFSYDLASQSIIALTGDRSRDENYPSWSPDGEWVAVVRRERGEGNTSTGNQIWLIRPDGSEAHQLTQVRDAYHRQPVWSPDGRHLLYSISSAGSSDAVSGIHILDIETGDVFEIAAFGSKPTWLP